MGAIVAPLFYGLEDERVAMCWLYKWWIIRSSRLKTLLGIDNVLLMHDNEFKRQGEELRNIYNKIAQLDIDITAANSLIKFYYDLREDIVYLENKVKLFEDKIDWIKEVLIKERKTKMKIVKMPKKYEKEEKRHDRVEEAEEKKHEKRHDAEEKRLLKKVKKGKHTGVKK